MMSTPTWRALACRYRSFNAAVSDAARCRVTQDEASTTVATAAALYRAITRAGCTASATRLAVESTRSVRRCRRATPIRSGQSDRGRGKLVGAVLDRPGDATSEPVVPHHLLDARGQRLHNGSRLALRVRVQGDEASDTGPQP